MDDSSDDAAGPEIPAPLDEPAERVVPFAKTLVLEHGIQLKNVGPDAWQYLAKGSKPTVSLSNITRGLGLSIVKVIIKGASRDHHFLLPYPKGPTSTRPKGWQVC